MTRHVMEDSTPSVDKMPLLQYEGQEVHWERRNTTRARNDAAAAAVPPDE